MISVSGVFRKVLTQVAPNPRSTGTGDTRIAASATPITSAPTVPAAVSLRIQRNPVTYTSTLVGSEKTSIVLAAYAEVLLNDERGRRCRPRSSHVWVRQPGSWSAW